MARLAKVGFLVGAAGSIVASIASLVAGNDSTAVWAMLNALSLLSAFGWWRRAEEWRDLALELERDADASLDQTRRSIELARMWRRRASVGRG